MKKLKALRIRRKRPKPRTLVLTGTFMLSLYGSLTRLPDLCGVLALISLLSSAAIGLYYFLRSP